MLNLFISNTNYRLFVRAKYKIFHIQSILKVLKLPCICLFSFALFLWGIFVPFYYTLFLYSHNCKSHHTKRLAFPDFGDASPCSLVRLLDLFLLFVEDGLDVE